MKLANTRLETSQSTYKRFTENRTSSPYTCNGTKTTMKSMHRASTYSTKKSSATSGPNACPTPPKAKPSTPLDLSK